MNSSVGKRLQAERRPEDGARKVAPSSITLHELARIGLVFDPLIPDIGPRIHEVNGNVPVFFTVTGIRSTL